MEDLPRQFTIRESSHRIHNPLTPGKLAAVGAALRLPPGTRVLARLRITLRHAFGSNAADAGCDIDVAADLLGHASVTSSQVYLHPDPGRLRASFMRCPAPASRRE
jgi:integrase